MKLSDLNLQGCKTFVEFTLRVPAFVVALVTGIMMGVMFSAIGIAMLGWWGIWLGVAQFGVGCIAVLVIVHRGGHSPWRPLPDRGLGPVVGGVRSSRLDVPVWIPAAGLAGFGLVIGVSVRWVARGGDIWSWQLGILILAMGLLGLGVLCAWGLGRPGAGDRLVDRILLSVDQEAVGIWRLTVRTMPSREALGFVDFSTEERVFDARDQLAEVLLDGTDVDWDYLLEHFRQPL